MSGRHSDAAASQSEPVTEAIEAEPAPEFVGPEAFSPQIIEAPAEPGEAPPEQREPLPKGHLRVVYLGPADVVDLKGADGTGDSPYVFRPGQPVVVPSEVAEELLTWPGETFEVIPEE